MVSPSVPLQEVLLAMGVTKSNKKYHLGNEIDELSKWPNTFVASHFDLFLHFSPQISQITTNYSGKLSECMAGHPLSITELLNKEYFALFSINQRFTELA